MGQLMTKRQVLRQLGAKDFKHLNQNQIIQCVSLLQKADPKVAMAALEQFPEYSKMATQMVDSCKETIKDCLDNNSESMNEYYAACNRVLGMLELQLQETNLTEEAKDKINQNILIVLQMMHNKDTENKEFLKNAFATIKAVAIGAASFGLVVLGANLYNKYTGSGPDDKDDSDLDEAC